MFLTDINSVLNVKRHNGCQFCIAHLAWELFNDAMGIAGISEPFESICQLEPKYVLNCQVLHSQVICNTLKYVEDKRRKQMDDCKDTGNR